MTTVDEETTSETNNSTQVPVPDNGRQSEKDSSSSSLPPVDSSKQEEGGADLSSEKKEDEETVEVPSEKDDVNENENENHDDAQVQIQGQDEDTEPSPDNSKPLEKLSGEDEKETATTKKNEASGDALPARPIKRARTAYFIFTDDKRPEVQASNPGEGVAVVARILGQKWSALSPEEKEKYQMRAAEERERVSKELEAYKAAGGIIEDSSSGGGPKDPNALIFPVARIKKIAKLDTEVKGMSKEAILLITKCCELATAKLGKETVRVAQLQNRRKLLPEDVAQVCSSREQFLFLNDDIKDLMREQIKENKVAGEGKAIKPNAADLAKETAAQGSKPLTSYFASK